MKTRQPSANTVYLSVKLAEVEHDLDSPSRNEIIIFMKKLSTESSKPRLLKHGWFNKDSVYAWRFAELYNFDDKRHALEETKRLLSWNQRRKTVISKAETTKQELISVLLFKCARRLKCRWVNIENNYVTGIRSRYSNVGGPGMRRNKFGTVRQLVGWLRSETERAEHSIIAWQESGQYMK